jgi:RHS repeat-associated protein
MSDSRSVSGEARIALPKGGGAMQGIGEKFTPDLHTGTSNFTVPIAVPPGRRGLQPELALAYSSGNPNSAFGLSWALGGAQAIQRQTSDGTPGYHNATDVFVMSGAEDLVPLPGGTDYRPRTEGLFAEIRHLSVPDDHWVVRSKDGLVHTYGSSAAAGQETATVADPADRTRIFQWRLTSTSDQLGNRIEYEYERDTGDDGTHSWDQLYLKTIRYTAYTDAQGQDRFLFSVELAYETRGDKFSDRRPGFEIRTRRRCRQIRVLTHAGATRLFRGYRLAYATAPNGMSLLASITQFGAAGSTTEEMPPLELGYTDFDPERRDLAPCQGSDLPVEGLGSRDLELVDLFGNGLPDILQLNGASRYWRNRGGGRFDPPRNMRSVPAGAALANPGVQLMDANGDARADLVVSRGVLAGYYPMRFGGLWDERTFHRFAHAPSFNLKDPQVRFTDVTGDGVPDAVLSATRIEVYEGDRERGFDGGRRVARSSLGQFPALDFSDPHLKWGDMTGDGRQDIVFAHDRAVRYWPSLGPASWGHPVTMRDSPDLPYGWDPRRLLVGDVDGDGLADFVYVDDASVTLWLNDSGNGFRAPIRIEGTPPVSDTTNLRLVDLYGSGVAGVLWSQRATPLARDRFFFLDFTGAVKPYLLDSIDNNLGSSTRVEYRPSTSYYLDGARSRKTRWKTPLPFPVQVVARVESTDAIAGTTVEQLYSYRHGYWDGEEREFRGFGAVTRFQRTGIDPPPTIEKTWFHLGAVESEDGGWTEADFNDEYWSDDPSLLERPQPAKDFLHGLAGKVRRDALRAMRGRTLRTELYSLDGSARQERPYTVSEELHAVAPLPVGQPWPAAPAPWQEQVFFPYRVASRSTQWERGDDPLTVVAISDEHDGFGQPGSETAVAMPRRSARRRTVQAAGVGQVALDETHALATHKRSEYAEPDQGLYLNSALGQERRFELATAPTVTESDPQDVRKVLADQVAAAWTIHARFRQLLEPWSTGQPLPAPVRLIGHTLNHYDGSAFAGRAAGKVGPNGLLTRAETLVFRSSELTRAYGTRRPGYLGGQAPIPAGAPASYGTKLGYRLETASASGYHDGWYADVTACSYDVQDQNAPQQRGVVTGGQDPRGGRTSIVPDDYWLLPAEVTDQVGVTTFAKHDYRVMQPATLTDANGHASRYSYTPLGLLERMVKVGRSGQGGTNAKPETRYEYDFHAYENTRNTPKPQPAFVHTRRRVWHASQGISDDEIETREYSDGFGRLIQTRAAAEELRFGDGDQVGLDDPLKAATAQQVGDSVVVSGWTKYDDKGNPHERYEPFLSTGWDYQPEADAKKGKHATMHYDPRGQLIRAVSPDGSELRVIFGVPSALDQPGAAEPTVWEQYTYDPDDLAPLSTDPQTGASLAGGAPVAQHYTPTSVVLDAIGRTIAHLDWTDTDPFVSRSAYDLRGNLLEITDPLGRQAARFVHDLRGALLRSETPDSGVRTTVYDAANNVVEFRDSKGSMAVSEYDAFMRLVRVWARDRSADPLTLRQQLVYGDEEPRPAALQRNAIGRLSKHYDEAGLLEFEKYDFDGNAVERVRTTVSDTSLAAGSAADWSAANADAALDPAGYRTSSSFDALGRAVEIEYPADVNGNRALLEPTYNRAGGLQRVELDGEVFLAHATHDAKGNRVLTALGNGIMTRCAYDPASFRLVQLRSERYKESPTAAPGTWTAKGQPLQDLSYAYDLAGNVLTIGESTPGCGVGATPDSLTRSFAYDLLYRLQSADGRVCKGAGSRRPRPEHGRCGYYPAPFDATAAPANAPSLTERYSETYTYDAAGNLTQLVHARQNAGNNGGFTRIFDLDPGTNQATGLKQGGVTDTFAYDANGNVKKINTSRGFSWNYRDELSGYVNKPQGAAAPSIEARYLYDADGARVKKWVRRNGTGGGTSTVYIDGVFEHYTEHDGANPVSNNHIHVLDGNRRLGLVRRGPSAGSDAGPAVQYPLGDHLGSSNVVLDDTGAWTNREEYTPFGQTSFGGYARKRFRFTGRERDEETGLACHGHRYYAPWLARWMSTDPAGLVESVNLYAYARNQPMRLSDPGGTQGDADTDYADMNVVTKQDEYYGGFSAKQQQEWIKRDLGKKKPVEPPAGWEASDPRLAEEAQPTADLPGGKKINLYETAGQKANRQRLRENRIVLDMTNQGAKWVLKECVIWVLMDIGAQEVAMGGEWLLGKFGEALAAGGKTELQLEEGLVLRHKPEALTKIEQATGTTIPIKPLEDAMKGGHGWVFTELPAGTVLEAFGVEGKTSFRWAAQVPEENLAMGATGNQLDLWKWYSNAERSTDVYRYTIVLEKPAPVAMSKVVQQPGVPAIIGPSKFQYYNPLGLEKYADTGWWELVGRVPPNTMR